MVGLLQEKIWLHMGRRKGRKKRRKGEKKKEKREEEDSETLKPKFSKEEEKSGRRNL